MAKVIAFQVEVNGVQVAIKNQNDLTAAVKLTDKTFKSTDFGTKEYQQSEKELAKLKTLQAKFRQDVKDTARDQEVAADKGKGSYRALNAELVNLRRRYKELSAEERGAFGPELLTRIKKLDTELKDIDASIGNFQRNVGDYSGGIKDAFASLGGVDLASLATVPGAIVAIGGAAINTAQYLKEVTDEFRKLKGEIQTLTGATGQQLDDFTVSVASIGETFNQSTNEIINAANSVSKQLGIPFEEAFRKIEEGFIAGSNQTGQFLDNLQEYPAFFKEAGLGADALFKTLNQQATQGIYSDKGVDVIKEVTLRLREQTTATQAALNGIGLDAQEVSKQISEEGIGAAIATVSLRLSELKADSPEVGAAIADIFGGPGEDAGLRFITSLKDINNATGSLIDSTNEYQLQQQRALQVNREFAKVQNDVAKEIGGAGAEFDNLGTIIKTKALQFLLLFIENIKQIFSALSPLTDELGRLFRSIGVVSQEGNVLVGIFQALSSGAKVAVLPLKFLATGIANLLSPITLLIEKGGQLLNFLGVLQPKTKKGEDAINGMAGAWGFEAEEQSKASAQIEDTSRKIEKLTKATNASAVATDAFAKGSIAALKKEISDLNRELDISDGTNVEGILSKLIDAEAALDKVEQFREELRNRLSSTRGPAQEISFLPTIDATVKQAEDSADRVLDIKKDLNEKILQEEVDLAAALREVQEGVFSGISDVLGSLTETSNIRLNEQTKAVERRYNREIELAEGNEELQAQLQNDLADEKAKIERREFERQKEYRRAAALAALAEGVINIISAPTTIPDPFGAIYKGVRIGILTATTAQQIANINAQTVGERGLIAEMAHGGILRGATHLGPKGGIPLVLNNQRVLAEHGEFVDRAEDGSIAVINKRSTAVHRKKLEQNYGRIWPGKRKWLSFINSDRHRGVKFAAEGAVLQPEVASIISGQSGGSQGPLAAVVMSSDIMQMAIEIATQTASAVREGSRQGVTDGMNDGTKLAQRQARLTARTGV